jgi:hypothetical protein
MRRLHTRSADSRLDSVWFHLVHRLGQPDENGKKCRGFSRSVNGRKLDERFTRPNRQAKLPWSLVNPAKAAYPLPLNTVNKFSRGVFLA